jgi:hypothetical protein
MLGVAWILKYKTEILIKLFTIGAKKEATTVFGGISFGTILIIGIIAVSIVFIHEVSLLFSSIFNFQLHDMGSPILLSILSVVGMSLCNLHV